MNSPPGGNFRKTCYFEGFEQNDATTAWQMWEAETSLALKVQNSMPKTRHSKKIHEIFKQSQGYKRSSETTRTASSGSSDVKVFVTHLLFPCAKQRRFLLCESLSCKRSSSFFYDLFIGGSPQKNSKRNPKLTLCTLPLFAQLFCGDEMWLRPDAVSNWLSQHVGLSTT